MGWSSGTFSITTTGTPVTTGTTISSTVQNSTVSEIATGVNQCVNKDGSNAITGNLNFAGFKASSIGAATLVSDAARASQVQNFSMSVLMSVGGSANAITGSLAPTPAAYSTGQLLILDPTATNTSAATINANSLGTLPVQLNGLALTGQEIVKDVPLVLLVDTSASAAYIVGSSGFAPMALLKTLCNGRLTATANSPINVSDVVSCSQMVFTPYGGNQIALYSTADSAWKVISFTEVSTAIPATASQNHDWFGYLSATGTLLIRAVSWTNDTTRSDAITLLHGVEVASANPAWRYLGTSATRAAGIVEDSVSRRYLWNMYNRVERPMRVTESTNTWTYTTASWRQANANAANRLDFVIGLSLDTVQCVIRASASNASAIETRVGIGVDSTSGIASESVNSGLDSTPATAGTACLSAFYFGYPGIGHHFFSWNELSEATGTTTWYGDGGDPARGVAGITGMVRG